MNDSIFERRLGIKRFLEKKTLERSLEELQKGQWWTDFLRVMKMFVVPLSMVERIDSISEEQILRRLAIKWSKLSI